MTLINEAKCLGRLRGGGRVSTGTEPSWRSTEDWNASVAVQNTRDPSILERCIATSMSGTGQSTSCLGTFFPNRRWGHAASRMHHSPQPSGPMAIPLRPYLPEELTDHESTSSRGGNQAFHLSSPLPSASRRPNWDPQLGPPIGVRV